MAKVQGDDEKNKRIIAALAILGAIQPTPIPLAGIHKFYGGQYGWGTLYLLLGFSQVPRVASMVEGIWYLVEPQVQKFWVAKAPGVATADTLGNLGNTVEAVASSLREIERLRQEGLLSEQEFEQKRRRLLEQMP